ncbi:MAG: hypothetical protein IJW82_03365 [Clostridia bacterium]|nr:hypothetical protein [Clostridia bacterium]
MDWMVKDLLNYDFSKKNKNAMIRNLLFLGIGKLDQRYNMPKGQLVGFMDASVGENLRACANQETGEIKFNANFLQDPKKYGRDMMTAFHELRHIAQYHGKKGQPAETDRLHLTYANHPDLVTMLVHSELCRPHESIGEAWRYDSTVTALFHTRWNQYLFAKYFHSPCEKDAREFGRKFLASIMNSVDTTTLSKKEKQNYDLILSNIKEDTLKEQEQSQKFSETIRTDEADFIKHCKEAQKKYSYMLDQATNMSESSAKDYTKQLGFDCFSAIFTSLCFVYDEKTAQTFYNSCLKMESKDNTYLSYALNLIKYSDFKPSEKQFKTLCEKCANFNKTCEDKSQHLDPKKTLEKMKTNQSNESMAESFGIL